MNTEDTTVGTGRLVKTENFQILVDQTEWFQNAVRRYEGRVDGYRISFYLRNCNRKEALQFLRGLEFAPLSEEE